MSKHADQLDLTRVGPGTVMGEFMRQYWIPALRCDELAPGGDPVRLMLLGEKLVAFRDTQGRVGVMDHRCPHRCASLFLGRNEEGGLRCIYHGWQFDVQGRCVDMPSVAPAQQFKDKVHAKAYRTAERAGVVWVYMGTRPVAPPLPMVEATLLPAEQTELFLVQRNCNWLQALEGDIDTSHFGFLHVGHLQPEQVPPGHPLEFTADDRAPQYHVEDAPWGTSYGAHRAVQQGQAEQTYWRCANYMFPFWTQTPQGTFDRHVNARAWVPLDDEHTMTVHFRWKLGAAPSGTPLKDGRPLAGVAGHDYLPNTHDWLGRWRLKAQEQNDWNLDRDAQRGNHIFSGINGIHLQDQAVCESMGAITDHSFEHLGPGDLMISRTRRRALVAARAFAHGEPAPGVDDPAVYLGARSGFFLADPKLPWGDAYRTQVAQAVRPVSASRTQEAQA